VQNDRPTFRDRQLVTRGVTLLELLIVLTIMLMITAATLPVMLPALQNRRMREGSRLVSTFISGARSRAIEANRPVGVVFERLNGLPMAAQLSYVEIPPPYSGDALNAALMLTVPPVKVTNSSFVDFSAIRYGDQIQFAGKGQLCIIANDLSNSKSGQKVDDPASVNWFLLFNTPAGLQQFSNMPPSYDVSVSPNGVSFQIFRQPVKSSGSPLQLPEGTVVDLLNSGVGLSGVFPTTIPPVGMWSTMPPLTWNPVVMFAPSGRLDYVTGPVGTLQRPTGPVFFLIGKRELLPDVSRNQVDENVGPDPAALPNAAMLYLDSFWVSISYQTGQVNVTENASNLGPLADPTNYLQNARTYAISGQAAGGR
jgi:prepilin-type N-terminal cleavage/methylation domain-containing protein